MKIELLPNILTGANLVVGMIALVYAIEGKYAAGSLLILVAALLDRLDGNLARKMGTNSEFGKEMDSLADLISFGVAPSVAAYLWGLKSLGVAGLLFMVLFVICGALRLARFNVMNVSGYFLGVPITVAGSLVAVMILVARNARGVEAAVLLVVLSGLMVSSIKIPKI